MANLKETLQRGWELHQSGQYDEAEFVYRSVLSDSPEQPETLVYLGILEFDRRRFTNSVACYRKALQQRDQFPIAWNNLGNSLRMVGQVDEADDCFERALRQDRRYVSALKNRGTLWVWNGDIERGLHWYQKGLEVDPGNAELHRNLGVILLLQGDYASGWPEYRWRWQMPGAVRPRVMANLWNGEDVSGKTVILYPEQGRGDSIQFIRVAKTLSDEGARVIFASPPEMIPLFSSVPGISQLVPDTAALPPAHYHASLIDVVDIWHCTRGALPTGDSSVLPAYLNVSTALVDYWKDWRNTLGFVGKTIGINWQGNPEHHADVYRSIPLQHFRHLAEIPNVQLINLQFGHGVEQLDSCDFSERVTRLPPDVDVTGGAFTDTLAIMKNLDHVVTSDTAIAHLAGACGAEVTMVVGKVPDWRWLTTGTTTAWYPTMSIVRQTEMGEWETPMRQVAESIRKRAS